MADKNTGGRPPLPEHSRRNVVINMRVNVLERDILATCAKASGQPISVYVREWAVSNARAQLGDKAPNCGDTWHQYAYAMDDPDERASRLPAECPSCGSEAPHVRKLSPWEHKVTVPIEDAS